MSDPLGMVELRILAVPVPGTNEPRTYNLLLRVDDQEPPLYIMIQEGYISPQQAAHALITALTTAPPDIAHIEEAAIAMQGTLDQIRDLNDAMATVGERLNELEEWKESGPEPKGGSRLLTQKRSQDSWPPEAVTAPPPIRRPLIPHQPQGGVFRPGEGEG